MKPYLIPQTTVEYLVGTAVAITTGLCLFPPPGTGLVWWELHAFDLMIAFLISGLLFFFINQSRLMLISFVGCATLCYFLNARTVSQLKPAELSENAFSLNIGAFRFSQSDSCAESVLQTILHSNLDIIALQEVRPAALRRIHDTLKSCGYPYYQFEPDRTRNREIAIYSRFPAEFLNSGQPYGLPCILGRLCLNRRDTLQELRFLYTSMPAADSLTEDALAQLYLLGRQLGQSHTPVLVMGNFNLVSWSYHLQVFKKQSVLRDSRRGIRPVSHRGHLTLFERPTDHIFYSDHFKCVSFKSVTDRNGADIGIVGTYQLQTKGQRKNARQTSKKF